MALALEVELIVATRVEIEVRPLKMDFPSLSLNVSPLMLISKPFFKYSVLSVSDILERSTPSSEARDNVAGFPCPKPGVSYVVLVASWVTLTFISTPFAVAKASALIAVVFPVTTAF
ncbi:hypothetical protein D3C78_1638310 [compost metagenome]